MPLSSQTFHLSDLGPLASLVLLEALLSADNALVLAILVKHLPGDQRKKALLYGLVGALIFRGIAVAFAGLILKLWVLQAVGALYLLYLPLKHFLTHRHDSDSPGGGKVGAGFWATVAWVELTDLAFAVDSILAGIAMVGTKSEKIWLVWAGGFLGVVILRFAANALIGVLERYPAMNHVAYLLVAWAGIKMATVAGETFRHNSPEVAWARHLGEMSPAVFWAGMAILFFGGSYWAFRRDRAAG